jgi:hypothetical protein
MDCRGVLFVMLQNTDVLFYPIRLMAMIRVTKVDERRRLSHHSLVCFLLLVLRVALHVLDPSILFIHYVLYAIFVLESFIGRRVEAPSGLGVSPLLDELLY